MVVLVGPCAFFEHPAASIRSARTPACSKLGREQGCAGLATARSLPFRDLLLAGAPLCSWVGLIDAHGQAAARRSRREVQGAGARCKQPRRGAARSLRQRLWEPELRAACGAAPMGWPPVARPARGPAALAWSIPEDDERTSFRSSNVKGT